MNRAETDDAFKESLTAALSSFRCEKDSDIENFLHTKAIDFDKRGLCRVYVILNEECMNDGILKIEAYFTLSMKSLVCESISTSKNKLKKYTHGIPRKTIDFVLIGQLGKHIDKQGDTYISSEISGSEILDMAFEVIKAIDVMIPCKIALVECNDEPNVKHVYEQYGFSFLQNDGEHNQYTMIII